MSITAIFTHQVEPDFEQYSFPSNVNPKQRHFIDRNEGEPWVVGIVQLEESLTLAELQELRVELADLATFMMSVQQREIRRRTEPGEPELAGIGGGL
ncbi:MULTISPECIES: hypothetical protein [unclassified Leucobacter]|uniref:hypothetical protein n=1 Tax=unclassified Leucobacter TaxID=2621730 RepID=UPI00301A5548